MLKIKNRSIYFFFFFILSLIITVNLIPKNNSFVIIRYETNNPGFAHLYVNGDWANPFKLSKSSGESTLRFGPINEDIKFLRFDPLDIKTSNVIIKEVSIFDADKKIYNYELDAKTNRRYEFIKSINFNNLDKSLHIEPDGITPINIYLTNEVRLESSNITFIKTKLDKFLAPEKLYINSLSIVLILSLMLHIYYRVSKNKYIIIIYTSLWFIGNIYFYYFLNQFIFRSHLNSITSNGSYLGESLNSNFHSYITVITINIIIILIINRNVKN